MATAACDPRGAPSQKSWLRWVAIARASASRWLRSSYSAEDLVTGALIRMAGAGVGWQSIDDGRFRSFLHYEILASHRRVRTQRSHELPTSDVAVDASNETPALEAAAATPDPAGNPAAREVDELLRKLPRSDALILRLRARGWTHAEIARRLKLTPVCVRQRFSRLTHDLAR